jgi:putative ABC transport system substrate-binding protein
MRRRDFIAALGCATAPAWARDARAQPATSAATAQQSSTLPLVGFLNSASSATYRFNANSFREGLAQAGFIEGRNVRIEERWANGDYQALPALAAELVAKGVVAIAATGDVASARAAKGASTTVPVVFTIGGDPVRFELVNSFNRPGGNVTGIMFSPSALGSKRVQLLHELVPRISRIRAADEPGQFQRGGRTRGHAKRRGQARPSDCCVQREERGGNRHCFRGDRTRQS